MNELNILEGYLNLAIHRGGFEMNQVLQMQNSLQILRSKLSHLEPVRPEDPPKMKAHKG